MASIKNVDRKLLWAKSGDECAFDGCRQKLTVDVGEGSGSPSLMVIGEEAHIVAREDDGPRGDVSMPISDRNSYSNLLLLCPTHHTLIDKEKGAHFSVEALREMKRLHEIRVATQREEFGPTETQARKETLLFGLTASRARLIARWIAVGVDPDTAEEMADDNSIGNSENFADFVSGRRFSILIGDFGSGKTVALERQFQACTLTALEDPSSPFPIYLNSTKFTSDLARTIEASTPRFLSANQRITLFVDGIDEFESHGVGGISDDLHEWTYSAQGRRVVATSRPDMNFRERDYIQLPPLTDDDLESLLERVGGTKQLAWGHSKEIRDALRRPLFALIAADCSRAGSTIPRSRGSFLEALVERALARTSSLSPEVLSLLSRLGHLTLNSGGAVNSADFGGREDQRQLIQTRLVIHRERSLSFALPVLGQYFAGQYVLENGLPDVSAFSARRRDQWREALVFAVSAGSWGSVNRLLSDMIKVDPGLSAWVVDKAIPAYTRNPSVGLPEPSECATRIHTAMDSWLGNVGLAGRVSEYAEYSSGKTVPIAVGGGEHSGVLTVAFLEPSSQFEERTLELTAQVDFGMNSINGRTIRRWYTGAAPSNFSAWPWRLSLSWIQKDLAQLLKTKSLPLPGNAAFSKEEFWNNIRTITNQKGFAHRPIDRREVLSRIDLIRECTSSFDAISFGGLILTAEQIEEVRERCSTSDRGAPEMFYRPYPVIDVPPAQGSGHIASLYSDPVLRDLVQQVYTNAISIYEDLLSTYFQPLKRVMRLGSLLPVAFNCKMSRAAEGSGILSREPMFSRVATPLPDSKPSKVVVEFVENLVDEPEYAQGWFHSAPMSKSTFRRMRPDSIFWSSPSISHERLHVYGNRPATVMAYRWLWGDLKSIGLIEGIAPYGE